MNLGNTKKGLVPKINFLILLQDDPDLCRSHHGSMLPLIFGLPFAPELVSPYPRLKGQQASLAQKLLTYWSNFATSG